MARVEVNLGAILFDVSVFDVASLGYQDTAPFSTDLTTFFEIPLEQMPTFYCMLSTLREGW